MVYGTGFIPVGDYDKSRVANLGVGDGTIDGGGGYTYFGPAGPARALGLQACAASQHEK